MLHVRFLNAYYMPGTRETRMKENSQSLLKGGSQASGENRNAWETAVCADGNREGWCRRQGKGTVKMTLSSGLGMRRWLYEY